MARYTAEFKIRRDKGIPWERLPVHDTITRFYPSQDAAVKDFDAHANHAAWSCNAQVRWSFNDCNQGHYTEAPEN